MNDSEVLPEVVQESKERLAEHELHLESVAADRGYCIGKRLKELEDIQIEAYIPLVRRTIKQGVWGSDKFIYDEEHDWYICPNGKQVRYKDNNGNSKRYRASYRDCKVCPLQQHCITKHHGRLLFRPVFKEQFDALEKRLETPMARQASRWRKMAERAFSELKNTLGMSKINTLGLETAQKKCIMAAVTYNLKKFMKYGYHYVSSPSVNVKKVVNNNSKNKSNASLSVVFNLFCFQPNILNLKMTNALDSYNLPYAIIT